MAKYLHSIPNCNTANDYLNQIVDASLYCIIVYIRSLAICVCYINYDCIKPNTI